MFKTRLHIAPYLVAILLLANAVCAVAQPERFYTVFQLIQSKDFAKAKSEVDLLQKNPKTANDPKTYYYKAIIYKTLYQTHESKDINSPSRKIAIEAFGKTIQLDIKNEYTTDSKKAIEVMVLPLKNEGSTALNREDYKTAAIFYNTYNQYHKYIDSTKNDLTAIFYGSYSSLMSQDYISSQKGFKSLLKQHYTNPLTYVYLSQSFWESQNQDSAISIIEKGYELYPENFKIENNYLDYYLLSGKIDALESKIKKQLKSDPKNTKTLLLMASLYDKKAEKDNDNRKKYSDQAKLAFTKVLEQDPNNFGANYKLGHKLYVDAVFKVSELDMNTDIFALETVQSECAEMYKQALNYTDKAYQIDSNNKDVLSTLSSIYLALNEPEKSNAIKIKLDTLKGY